ncbi:hypothetical protein RGUI_4113 [Rhodovulum sp. P5]|uniref:CZB domain-containing protein n=1 Tax=Rhodovulum sp. P5 TaxID=1564506 RepID=UPI0009C24EDD|nr:CZB domain-containing protein [Rhodovulum sp. P5]ARE42254.1 hypothetical protein RGUI_4113 [Rhodovulum sp. P5]
MTSYSEMTEEIAAAQMKHLKWRGNLARAIAQGRSEISPEKAGCDRSCDFGKWFHGPSIPAELKSGEAWNAINAAHASFHKTAAEVLTLAIGGQPEEARALLTGTFCDKADGVLKALSLWKYEMKTKDQEQS